MDEHALVPASTESLGAELPDELRGLFNEEDNLIGSNPQLPRIGIAHQAQMFKMPDGSKTDHFVGVILEITNANAYWEKDFSNGGGEIPDCFSRDGIKPDSSAEDPRSDLCGTCPENRYETAAKGRGKACKNMKRLYLLLEGYAIPCVLSAPPSNLRVVDDYMVTLTNRRLPRPLAVTSFTLLSAKNNDGIEFSKLHMELLGAITSKSVAEQIAKLRNDYLDLMRGLNVTSDDV